MGSRQRWRSCAPKLAATPMTRALTGLIGELSTRSQEFRTARRHTTYVAAPPGSSDFITATEAGTSD
jgi:hypothetical protein